jgi:MoaA/NifB/PqqE/SkfB family radical SAM enzyme
MQNFCVIPWYSQELDLRSGVETVCCWIDENISRHQLQQQFLSGQRPSQCQRCWQSESQGIESRRQMENRFLDFKMNRDLEFLAHDVAQGQSHINMYQLFLGSTCNGACVTCGPESSSLWRSLQKRTVSIRSENTAVDDRWQNFCSTVDWTAAKRFNLLGGEPLLLDKSFDVLQKLLQAGNTDCRVSFVTNGSVTPNKHQRELFKQFTDISCCVSIDGIGSVYEYLRYPLSWSAMEKNLAVYQEIFSEVVVNVTISNLNYHLREEIVAWLQKMQLKHFETYVSDPPWFNCEVTPEHALWPRFVQEIQTQDNIKQINIEDYMPDIAQLIQESTTVQHKML